MQNMAATSIKTMMINGIVMKMSNEELSGLGVTKALVESLAKVVEL